MSGFGSNDLIKAVFRYNFQITGLVVLITDEMPPKVMINYSTF
jgi:hypothetical protein